MTAMILMQAALPGEGDPITSLNASLDGSMLAVQRGTAFLQFIHLTSSKMFVQVLCLDQTAQRIAKLLPHISFSEIRLHSA